MKEVRNFRFRLRIRSIMRCGVLRVEVRGRFIGDDHYRTVDQCAGNGNALPLPTESFFGQ